MISYRLYTTVYKLFLCHYGPSFFFELQTLVTKALIGSPWTLLLSFNKKVYWKRLLFWIFILLFSLYKVLGMGMTFWKIWKVWIFQPNISRFIINWNGFLIEIEFFFICCWAVKHSKISNKSPPGNIGPPEYRLTLILMKNLSHF